MEDSKLGEPIWDILFEAGANMDVKTGCPNPIERIEAGLLSYGNDMTNDHTPHQSGLSKFCDTKKAIKCIGRDALLEEIATGPWRQIRFLEILGKPHTPRIDSWDIRKNNIFVGKVSSAAWSPDFKTNVAIGIIHRDHLEPGTVLIAETPVVLANF